MDKTMAHLVLLESKTKTPMASKLCLIHDTFLIGRSIQNSYVIEDMNISRMHCMLEKVEGIWNIQDMSSNGTLLNGTLMTKAQRHRLKEGDKLRLGDTVEYIFTISTDSTGPNDHSNCIAHINIVIQPDPQATAPTNAAALTTCPEATTSTSVSTVPKVTLEYAEDELQCSICTEMFIKAVTLSCSHTYCKYCLWQWQKSHGVCPICRARITNQYPTLVLDNFIEKMLANASDEVKEQRAKIIEEREKNGPPSTSNPKYKGFSWNSPNSPVEVSSDDSSDSWFDDSPFLHDDDDEDDVEYNGLPHCYFGGYGRCFVCGDSGHWANGCPNKRRYAND